MAWLVHFGRWLFFAGCWIAISGLQDAVPAALPSEFEKANLWFVFSEASGKDSHEGRQVMGTLANKFIESGYPVLTEARAKRPSFRPIADVNVSVQTRTVTRKEGDAEFEVYKVSASAEATMDCTGEVLAAETASVSRPFDRDGALESAGTSLATKILEALGNHFVARDRIDYRLVILDGATSDANAFPTGDFQNALLSEEGVFLANQCGRSGTARVLSVSLNKNQRSKFEELILMKLSTLGVEGLNVVSRQGNVVFLSVEQRKPSEAKPLSTYKEGYDSSWAVVIGIDNYVHWSPLAYAVSDAKKIRESVQPLGFDRVISLLDGDATKERILQILGDVLHNKAKMDDRVLIFFAGHGHTEVRRDGTREGYIVPVDGNPSDPSSYISMERIQELADHVSAKHLLYIMDSCFSGGLVRFRGEIGPMPIFRPELSLRDILAITRFPVRQVLTCGREGERVVERDGHGVCTDVILDGLAGKADLNGDDFIVANELSRFAAVQVEKASRGLQHPEFGYLLAKRANALGDFVLRFAGPSRSQ